MYIFENIVFKKQIRLASYISGLSIAVELYQIISKIQCKQFKNKFKKPYPYLKRSKIYEKCIAEEGSLADIAQNLALINSET